MNLIKFNPFLPVNAQFGNAFDSFFNRSLGDLIGSDFVNEIPRANVIEQEEGWEIEVAVPGFSKEDFQIEIKDNNLILTAKKESQNDGNKGEYRRREFSYTAFTRSFPLNKYIDGEKITAEYEKGILKINLPKQEKLETKKLIEVS